MKTIKARIILTVVICSLLSAGICGGISVVNSGRSEYEDSKEEMRYICENLGAQMEAQLERVEQSVNTAYSIVLQQLDDVEAFKKDKAYVDAFTEIMEQMLYEVGGNTEGALTAYIRYNPDFTEPDSGVFLTRDNDTDEFTSITPTDFSMYDPGDLEHVGWYYIPVQHGAPLWMDPYLNSNINVYMVSYVIPITIDGESIGIIGMDIDFGKFTEAIDSASVFESGYAFLTDGKGNIVYHKELEVGTAVDTVQGAAGVKEALLDPAREKMTLNYSFQGEDKELCYVTLRNDMRYVLTAPEKELRSAAAHIILLILCGALVAMVISVLIGAVMGIVITRPITQINEIVESTAQFNFQRNENSDRLCKRKDESGNMANSLREMRASLRAMAADIQRAHSDLDDTLKQLTSITDQVQVMSGENSETTQGLAAAMEETAAAMETVNHTVSHVKERAQTIRDNSREGEQASIESRHRADNLKNTTGVAQDKTTQMYRTVQEKSAAAMEQAKAVEKINQLTQSILDISGQTNLLALNASIEAARAGEAGRGFSVVADQIRQLAEQSSKSAVDTRALIEGTMQEVENGNRVAGRAVESIQTVVEGIRTVADSSREVSVISENQAATMKEAEIGVNQISDVIQTNAALAEESSATSEELSAQASTLDSLIAKFKLPAAK